ncbi:MAG: GIY-YIG nuclease family protein [Devosia sp.]|nr:GIY-YIG nuclease family protein [Devosia sp.]
MMASGKHGTIYIGVTSDLVGRVWLHRNYILPGSFTDRYNVTQLVWYELHGNADTAITREKRLKEWRRAWKVELIEAMNPGWDDLWDQIVQ